MIASGYGHPAYASTFAEFGEPRMLPGSGGWVLQRRTPALPYTDAMGGYPVFSCRDWNELPSDLDLLAQECVSLVLVTDPFGQFNVASLSCQFDSVVPYKDHLVTDLREYSDISMSAKTRRNVRNSLKNLHVEVCPDPESHLDDWVALYADFCASRGVTGIRKFSRQSFRNLFSVPGLTVLRAFSDNVTVGINLWMESGNVAYGHLGATNALGRRHMAFYALYWLALNHFRDRVRWLDLGSTPGQANTNENGLFRFKQRWATGCRPVFLCTRVFDPDKYSELVRATGRETSEYFPAYRQGEF